MDIRDLAGRTALVTGAASGIGRETALACGRRGANLVICDVNEDELSETETALVDMGCEVLARCVDVADANQMRAFADDVHSWVEAVDLLVNNAGVGIAGGFLATELDDWDWIIGVNLRGVIHGCHFFVPRMVERGRGGHVVNISSIVGYLGSESLAAYATTKFAVIGLSESLHDELRRRGIGVTCACPAIVATNITRNAQLRGAFARNPRARDKMTSAYQSRRYPPALVAKQLLRAVQKNRVIAPISPEAWMFYYTKRFAPWLIRLINARLGDHFQASFGAAPADEPLGQHAAPWD